MNGVYILIFKFYNWEGDGKASNIVMFTFGATTASVGSVVTVLIIGACQTKLTPPERRLLLLGFNGFMFMGGRGVGSIVGLTKLPQNDFAGLIMGIAGVALLVHLLAYRYIRDSAKAD